jgi:hypothetical protein
MKPCGEEACNASSVSLHLRLASEHITQSPLQNTMYRS